MAIRVLLDHGVREDHIIFITLLVARRGGVSVLQRAFPAVTVVAGAIDHGLEDTWIRDHVDAEDSGHKAWVIEPGMGNMGKRTGIRIALVLTPSRRG
jgi:uridine kinase